MLLGDTQAVEGDWLIAERQTAGRGRQGRDWKTLDGNFFGSTLVVIQGDDPPASSLSLAAGLALYDAVASTGQSLDLMLKWPNDLLLDGGKLSGILLEREGDRLVVGMGVNLAHAPQIEGRETASLAPKVTIPAKAFAPLLAASFQRMLSAWRTAEPSTLASLWMEKAHPIGTPLGVHDSDGTGISGSFSGLEADGSMRLRLDSGEERVIHAGDVSLAPGGKGA